MSRVDRYQAAVMLAQEILAAQPGDDEHLIYQALQDVTDEVSAGRRNQAEFPAVAQRVVERRLAELFSVRADLLETPQLRLVKGDL